jgi:hypothetical protein
MKKKILKSIGIIVSVMIVFSFAIGYSAEKKEAKAAMICELNGDWARVCCFTDDPGGCNALDYFNIDGPYIKFVEGDDPVD